MDKYSSQRPFPKRVPLELEFRLPTFGVKQCQGLLHRMAEGETKVARGVCVWTCVKFGIGLCVVPMRTRAAKSSWSIFWHSRSRLVARGLWGKQSRAVQCSERGATRADACALKLPVGFRFLCQNWAPTNFRLRTLAPPPRTDGNTRTGTPRSVAVEGGRGAHEHREVRRTKSQRNRLNDARQ